MQSLQETNTGVDKTTDCKEQTLAPSLSKTQSPHTLNEETEKDTSMCTDDKDNSALTAPLLPSQAPCTDIWDTSSAVNDDSDGELPSFDIFSSFGIKPV